MFLFCLVFAMFCARLFICALWSPAGKGLTSWLSFVVSSVSLSLSHWYPGSGVVLDCSAHALVNGGPVFPGTILGHFWCFFVLLFFFCVLCFLFYQNFQIRTPWCNAHI